MARTARARWGLLRPGATVSSGPSGPDRRVVSVDHRGTTVSVLFWDGTRELHREDAVARVRIGNSSSSSRSRR